MPRCKMLHHAEHDRSIFLSTPPLLYVIILTSHTILITILPQYFLLLRCCYLCICGPRQRGKVTFQHAVRPRDAPMIHVIPYHSRCASLRHSGVSSSCVCRMHRPLLPISMASRPDQQCLFTHTMLSPLQAQDTDSSFQQKSCQHVSRHPPWRPVHRWSI